MNHFNLNSNGQLLNSCNQQVGIVDNFNQVKTNFGLPTNQFVSGGVIRDGYYNVVGTVNNLPPVPNIQVHPTYNY